MPHAASRPAPLARAAIGAVCVLSSLAVAPGLGAQAPAVPAWAAALDSAVTAELTRTRTPGAQVAVVVDGRVAYSRGYGVADVETGRAVTPRTLFRVGSVTKMFTAALLAQLAAEGKLDLQAPIGRVVPELTGRKVGTVTTHQLLTHAAGWLDNAVAYGRMGESALGEVMREVGDTMFFTEPGRVMSYSNPGFSMAGYVAEVAGKGRFGNLLEERVLRPTGMPRATLRPLAAMTQDFSQGHIGQPGNPGAIVRPFTENTAQWAAGFLFSSAEEVARFAIMLMDGGTIDGQRVLAEDAVRAMTTGHQVLAGTTARYGYGLRVETRDGQRVWSHGGAINGFDAMVTMFPDRKVAVVVLDNRGGAPLVGLTDLVARAVGAPPAPAPATPAERIGTAAERAQVVGTYAQGRTSVRIVEAEGELRLLQGTEREPVRLAGDDRIVVGTGDDAQTLFLVRGPDGRVAYLSVSSRALARQPER
ncbi:MAG: beta-lactamase family protein [Gemmatimonadaceae bacterium]|nr:beta-lactamase family protein [Gemmatimonadaceae bacterium]